MTHADSAVPIRQLILFPALITLAVTVFRFLGEVERWSPGWFNHRMGWSVVAILWLVPVFGISFALKLAASGGLPASSWRAIGLAVLGALIVLFLPGMLPFNFGFPSRLLYEWSIVVLAALVTVPGPRYSRPCSLTATRHASPSRSSCSLPIETTWALTTTPCPRTFPPESASGPSIYGWRSSHSLCIGCR